MDMSIGEEGIIMGGIMYGGMPPGIPGGIPNGGIIGVVSCELSAEREVRPGVWDGVSPLLCDMAWVM